MKTKSNGLIVTHAIGALRIGLLLTAVLMTTLPIWAATPSVDNANGASNVLSISAELCGTLTSTGGAPTQVNVYWGESDGETNATGRWDHMINLGVTNPVGPVSQKVTELWPNRMYYYRFYATNPDGEVWASATTNFQTLASVGPAQIDLGSCSHFTILAGSTTTTTGGGTINGDVGIFPAGAQEIPPAQINGTIYNGGSIAAQAQLDLTSAILAASPAQLPGGINAGAELGGKTLVAGVYQSPSGAYDITSVDLTLHGGPHDVWVFQMASTLTVGVGRQVILTGGARAKNIFWQVGSSATLGTSSVFKGTVMAYASVTMNASSTMEGRALAQTGAVTFNGTGGDLPVLIPPRFTQISRTGTTPDNMILSLSTTPYLLLTLETSPDLSSSTSWTAIATNSPMSSTSNFTDLPSLPGAPRCFYRAFITDEQ